MPQRPEPAGDQNRLIADDDAGFVTRCQRGDTEAFAFLVRMHQKKMLNIAYRMIGDVEESCDVVQEAFLAAWRGIGKFRREARFSTWLCGIVLNHARDHMTRKAARERSEGVSLDEAVPSADGQAFQGSCSQNASVIDEIEKREREFKIQQCIKALEGEQREVLILRDIQGFSYQDIAAMLQLPEGTVRSRLFRARSVLKKGLLKVFGDSL